VKPTPTQEKQVTEWFMSTYWPTYPGKFCGRGKGSRAISCKHMVAINPDLDEQVRIINNLKAQIRAHMQKPESMRRFWKIGETYTLNKLWDDEIESTMEIKAKQDLKTCSKCGKNEVHGEKYLFCPECIPCQHDDDLRAAWKKTGISRTSPTMRADCLEYLNSIGMGGYAEVAGLSDE